MKKAAIIGIDGAPYELISEFARTGIMPKIAGLIERYGLQRTVAPLPEISPVSWMSLVTGMNPGEHGVFGFTELDKNAYTYTFPNFPSLAVKTVWEAAMKEGTAPSLVVNLPHTYPVRPMKGVLVSGFVAVDINKAVFPLTLAPRLRALNYRFDPDFSLMPEQKTKFLADVRELLAVRFAFFQEMLEQEWGFYTYIITETDRLNHFFYDCFKDADGQFRQEFLEIYREVDRQVGILADYFTEKRTPFIIVSDHGFVPIGQEIYISQYLREWGFLHIKPPAGEPWRDLAGMSEKTSAFCLDPSRIYLHRKGRYSRGSVAERDCGRLLAELKQRFLDLEFGGEKVIARVYEKEEIYHGRFLDRAPDLVLVSHDGFDLKSGLARTSLTGRTHFTGMHSHHNAFLIDGCGLEATEGSMIADVGRRLINMRENN